MFVEKEVRRRVEYAPMADPLSIAALTIAVIDDLIRIGERTAELISDARAFKEVLSSYLLSSVEDEPLTWLYQDAVALHTHLLDERSRTRCLKALLFSEANA